MKGSATDLETLIRQALAIADMEQRHGVAARLNQALIELGLDPVPAPGWQIDLSPDD